MTAGAGLPLAGVRVIDTTDGTGAGCGRYLADLGADVVLVEPPGGAASRRRGATAGGHSLPFAVHHANQRGVVADLETEAGRAALAGLLAGADVWLDATPAGTAAPPGLDVGTIRAANPALVVVSITDFGQTGPYRDYVATEWVHLAMGGVLSRSGLPGRAPLLPPAGMALETTAVQAAWAALIAYWRRLATGEGTHVDFSILEATAQIVDPGMGTVGTAQAGGPAVPRDRPAPGPYPIFPCADGHVRIVVLSPRQWRGIRGWLGDPPELMDPELEKTLPRMMASALIYPYYERFFAGRPKAELVAEGQARGVPIAPVLTPADVLEAEHYRARGALVDAELAPGVTAPMPSGYVDIDGRRAGFRHRAPAVGEHTAAVLGEAAAAAPAPGAWVERPVAGARPLEGLRVLDLGVIVMGAEIARLFADQGAEVIKIENRAYPDGSRTATASGAVSPYFAIGHRNSKSLGLNLRVPEGIALFKQLAARSDVVLSNFKPGTMEGLGLGYDVLRDVNPRLVMVSSSAVGATGPWSTWMGYGPLVRAASGVTSLWRYPEDETSFSDGVTIFPDHFAARVGAVAGLAGLIGRSRTGRGAHVESSQAEAILTHMADQFVAEHLAPGTARPIGDALPDAAPWGVFPCAGDDEWCVVCVRDDEDWRRLRTAMGNPAWARDPALDTMAGRLARRAVVDDGVRAWTRSLAPRAVTAAAQAHAVPAGFMQRITEYPDDPHFAARGFLQEMHQPGLDAPIVVETGPFTAPGIPVPEARPAPEHGEHTRELATALLGLDDAGVDALLQAGVLEAPVAAGVA